MKILSIFLAFYLFFPRNKLFLGFILNLENAEMWSPPVIEALSPGVTCSLAERGGTPLSQHQRV
jgi:hypothetical protein